MTNSNHSIFDCDIAGDIQGNGHWPIVCNVEIPGDEVSGSGHADGSGRQQDRCGWSARAGTD